MKVRSWSMDIASNMYRSLRWIPSKYIGFRDSSPVHTILFTASGSLKKESLKLYTRWKRAGFQGLASSVSQSTFTRLRRFNMHEVFSDTVAPADKAQHPARQILYRTLGRRQGSVTRLVSPSDIGKLIKPFVFLDNFDLVPADRPLFGLHPHSGIATLTVILSGRMDYQDTTGMSATLATGGVGWMNAGGGVWHAGGPADGDTVRGFQPWVALPPEEQNGPAHTQYLPPE